jgi:hypothetical protein
MSTLGRARSDAYPMELGRLGRLGTACYPIGLGRISSHSGRYDASRGHWVSGYAKSDYSGGPRGSLSPSCHWVDFVPIGRRLTHASTHAKSGLSQSLLSLWVYWVQRVYTLLYTPENALTGRRTRTSRTIERVLARRNRTQIPNCSPSPSAFSSCGWVAFREGLPKCA